MWEPLAPPEARNRTQISDIASHQTPAWTKKLVAAGITEPLSADLAAQGQPRGGSRRGRARLGPVMAAASSPGLPVVRGGCLVSAVSRDRLSVLFGGRLAEAGVHVQAGGLEVVRLGEAGDEGFGPLAGARPWMGSSVIGCSRLFTGSLLDTGEDGVDRGSADLVRECADHAACGRGGSCPGRRRWPACGGAAAGCPPWTAASVPALVRPPSSPTVPPVKHGG